MFGVFVCARRLGRFRSEDGRESKKQNNRGPKISFSEKYISQRMKAIGGGRLEAENAQIFHVTTNAAVQTLADDSVRDAETSEKKADSENTFFKR